MTNEKDKSAGYDLAIDWTQSLSGDGIETDEIAHLGARIADLLATVRAEEKDAALSIVRACSTCDELYPDISITVSEFKERVIGLLKAENRKGEG